MSSNLPRDPRVVGIREGRCPACGGYFFHADTCTRFSGRVGDRLTARMMERGVCPRCHAETKPGERVYEDGSCAPRCLPTPDPLKRDRRLPPAEHAVCPNCGQWQRSGNDRGAGPDCLNECRGRGFAPPETDAALTRRIFDASTPGAKAVAVDQAHDEALRLAAALAPIPKVRVWGYKDGTLLPDGFEAEGLGDGAQVPCLIALLESLGVEVCFGDNDPTEPDSFNKDVATWHDVTETAGEGGPPYDAATATGMYDLGDC